MKESATTAPASDVAFTPTVKAVQERRGSRRMFERMEARGGWSSTITFIANVRSFYFATASKDGQPYVQHRGGPPGFLRVLDDKRLAFVDFTGNRQYITTGNLAENPRAFIFLMDYERRRRVKFWGTAEAIEGNPELIRSLFPGGYSAEPVQAIIFTLIAFDRNCAQHIPKLFRPRRSKLRSKRSTDGSRPSKPSWTRCVLEPAQLLSGRQSGSGFLSFLVMRCLDRRRYRRDKSHRPLRIP